MRLLRRPLSVHGPEDRPFWRKRARSKASIAEPGGKIKEDNLSLTGRLVRLPPRSRRLRGKGFCPAFCKKRAGTGAAPRTWYQPRLSYQPMALTTAAQRGQRVGCSLSEPTPALCFQQRSHFSPRAWSTSTRTPLRRVSAAWS